MKIILKDEVWEKIKHIALFMNVDPTKLLSEMIRGQISFAMDEVLNEDIQQGRDELHDFYWELYDKEHSLDLVLEN